MVMTWNPYRHLVCDPSRTELGRWLLREFPDIRGLFVYFHAEAGNWVIGKWVSRQAGRFRDLFVVGPSLQDFTRGNALEVRRRVKQPPEHRALAELAVETEDQELRRLTDESYIDSEKRKPRKIQVLGG